MNFSEVAYAFAGGLLIGLAAILLLWANGKVAGVSGMLGALFQPEQRREGWQMAFLVGLIVGGGIIHSIGYSVFAPMPGRSHVALILSGLLVGIGTQLGSGCTSGHGVCGLGRLSFRSLLATITFIVSGAVTVFVIRYFLGSAL